MKKPEKATTTEKEKLKRLERLIKVLEDTYPSTRKLIWRSFLRGIFIGLGTTIGASIVIAVLSFLISQLRLVPIIRDFVIRTNLESVFSIGQ